MCGRGGRGQIYLRERWACHCSSRSFISLVPDYQDVARGRARCSNSFTNLVLTSLEPATFARGSGRLDYWGTMTGERERDLRFVRVVVKDHGLLVTRGMTPSAAYVVELASCG
jgi:hypothetical protein